MLKTAACINMIDAFTNFEQVMNVCLTLEKDLEKMERPIR